MCYKEVWLLALQRTAKISLSSCILVCFPHFRAPSTHTSAGDRWGLPAVPNLIFFKPPIILPQGEGYFTHCGI